MADFVRTPESRFSNLPNFPYKPHYVTLPSSQNLRLAYIDEQTPSYSPTSSSSRVFLCLHGVPTWSYLYRKMIPVFLNSDKFHNQGVRVICPDFIGWGRSDKPLSNTGHRIHNLSYHRQSIVELIESLNLNNITLVVQDWGGLMGLTVPCFYDYNNININISIQQSNIFKSRFNRVIFFNTVIPTGDSGPGFMNWRNYVKNTPDMNVKNLIRSTVYPKLGKLIKKMKGNKNNNGVDELDSKLKEKMVKEEWFVSQNELNAYDAPFVDVNYKYAIQTWPLNVPISKDYEGMDVWRKTREFWDNNRKKGERGENGFINVFMAHGYQDPVFPRSAAYYMFRLMVPNGDIIDVDTGMATHCGGILWVPYGGHFLQEQGGDYVARKALKYFGDIPHDPVEYEWCLTKIPNKKNPKKLITTCNVLKLILNNKPVNTFNDSLRTCLSSILTKFDTNSFVRGFILTSNFSNFTPRSRIFSAGLDLFEINSVADNNTKLDKELRNILSLQRIFLRLKKPIIAAINGITIAFACVITSMCDYRIMLNLEQQQNNSNNNNNNICTIGIPESPEGISIAYSGYIMIKHLCGASNASYIGQTGLMFDCNEAIKIGLIDEQVLAKINNVKGVRDIIINEQTLLQQCCNVLGMKFFIADVNAAADVKYLGKREIIETFENEDMVNMMTENARKVFQSNGMRKHTNRIAQKSKL